MESPKPSSVLEKSNATTSVGSLLEGGGGTAPKSPKPKPKPKPVSISVHVSLDSKDNVNINFAKLVEEKYGYETLYGRPPHHVQTRPPVLVDGGGGVDSQTDDDQQTSNNNHNNNNNNEEEIEEEELDEEALDEQKRKAEIRRKKIQGKYDLNDPFIDDSEMVWQDMAVSTQDGFFVFSGPLIVDGEDVDDDEDVPKPATNKRSRQPGGGGQSKRVVGGTISSPHKSKPS